MTNNRKVGSPKPQALGAMRVAQAAKKVKQKNPRRVRVLTALLARPHSREELDRIAGASNVPDIMMRMDRELGIRFECESVDAIDRDGFPCRPGIYTLTDEGREKAEQWLQPGVGTADDSRHKTTGERDDGDDAAETIDGEPSPSPKMPDLLAAAALFPAAGPAQRAQT